MLIINVFYACMFRCCCHQSMRKRWWWALLVPLPRPTLQPRAGNQACTDQHQGRELIILHILNSSHDYFPLLFCCTKSVAEMGSNSVWRSFRLGNLKELNFNFYEIPFDWFLVANSQIFYNLLELSLNAAIGTSQSCLLVHLDKGQSRIFVLMLSELNMLYLVGSTLKLCDFYFCDER